MQLLPIILLLPVMLAVGFCDFRYMKIPNVLSVIGVIIFIGTAFLLPVPEIGMRILAGVIAMLVGFILFALRVFGGGDVKIFSVLMLFIPSQTIALFGLVFSISILFGIGLIMTLRTAPGAQESRWVSLKERVKFPMGISISLAAVSHPFMVSALQF